jgi:Spy/CpxP family protein refolding chaperone
MRRVPRVTLMTAGLCLAIGTMPMSQDAVSPALDKPLKQFTIGDLFPRIDAGIEQTAQIWKDVSEQVVSAAHQRQSSLKTGVATVKKKADGYKAEAKAAKKSKDFTAQGTAEGKLKTEEVVKGILTRLQTLADRQSAAGDSWRRTALAMENYVKADKEFDAYRSRGIARPEPGDTQDNRLDAAGAQAFKNHAQAYDELGAAFADLGSDLQAMASDRLKFLSALEKGGHIQTAPMPKP